MSIVSEPKLCPKCGAIIPAEAPQGLCPKCLLQEISIPTDAGQTNPGKPAPPSREELIAAFPQLEILELIGQGGMGFVFKARQPKLDRFVALKILPQSLAADPAFAERFSREGRLLARLNHPNIVTVHDFGRAELPLRPNIEAAQQRSPTGEFFYLLMEYVDGVNLRQAMRAGRFTPDQALAVVPKICEALQFAHNEGILHRDIKPENILLDTKGRVKIADFGIAKLVSEAAEGRARHSVRAESDPATSGAHGVARPTEDLTHAGKTLGTPNYMAPEQTATPGEVDHRADIYSLGVVFYEMLTGELPRGKFQPPSQKSSADPRLDNVVLRALEREPNRRTQSAEEVKTQVETIAETSSKGGMATEKPTPTNQTEVLPPPRFSRMAIVGACWAGIACLGFLLGNVGINVGFFLPESLWMLVILSAPFGTTILGWITVSKIRRSAGKLHGIGLAVFDGLFFPLLALDAAIFGLAYLTTSLIAKLPYFASLGDGSFGGGMVLGYQIAMCSFLWIGGASLISAITDFFIIRRVWRAVKKPLNVVMSPPTQTEPNRFWKRFAVVVGVVLLALILLPVFAMLLAIAVPAFQRARQEKSVPHSAIPKPAASAETWSPILAPGEKPDLQKIADDAKDLMNKGRYEEALQQYIWYHNHSLDGQAPSVGARLFLIISDWVELGRRYPKAKQALIELRDAKAREFAEGRGYFQLFSEVKTINQYISQDNATVSLFKSIDQHDPALASQCYLFAEDVLARVGEYALCAKYLGDPQAKFNQIRRIFDMEQDSWKRMEDTNRRLAESNRKNGLTNSEFRNSLMVQPAATIKKSSDDRFVEQTCRLIEILVASGNKTEAEKIRERAIPLLDDARLKTAISDAEQRVNESNKQSSPVSAQLLAESPKLQFVAWQDEWKTNQPGAARHPDGSAITDAKELKWLQEIHPGGMDIRNLRLNPEPRFLHVWISHPLFASTMFNEITLLDERGKIIPHGGSGNANSSSQASNPHTDNLGWLTVTFSPFAGTNIPEQVTINLRYTIGPLENTQNVEVTPKSRTSMTLEGGGQLNGLGQTVDGNAFISIAVNKEKLGERQFGAVAVTKDGREVLSSGGNSSGTDRTGVGVASFEFDIALDQVTMFHIGTRTIRTVEWKNVLMPRRSDATVHLASEILEAKARLAELRVEYTDDHLSVQASRARLKELERMAKEDPDIPADTRDAKLELAELRVEFTDDHPSVKGKKARISELERMSKEEPNASAPLREAKAKLAERRVEFAEDYPEIRALKERVRVLEGK